MKATYQIYDQGDDVLLAACDKEILGECLEEGEIHLDINESFYGGHEIEIEELKNKFGKSTIANLVGEEVVEAAIETGFGSEEDIIWIEETPHLQIVRV